MATIRQHTKYVNTNYNPPLELIVVEKVIMNPNETLQQVLSRIPTNYVRSDKINLNLQQIIVEEMEDGEPV